MKILLTIALIFLSGCNSETFNNEVKEIEKLDGRFLKDESGNFYKASYSSGRAVRLEPLGKMRWNENIEVEK